MNPLEQRVRQFERDLIEETITACGGHKARAAAVLGITPRLLYDKTRRDWQSDPAARWDDPPLAWAVRLEGDRVEVGACWTREEVEADALNASTAAIVLERGAADNLAREMNTTFAARPAKEPRIATPEPLRAVDPILAASQVICAGVGCGKPFHPSSGWRTLCRSCRCDRMKAGHRSPYLVAKVG